MSANRLDEFAAITTTYAEMVRETRGEVHRIRNETTATLIRTELLHKREQAISKARFDECELRSVGLTRRIQTLEERK